MRNRKVEVLKGRIAALTLTPEEKAEIEARFKAKSYPDKSTVPMSPRACSKRERDLREDAKVNGGVEVRSTRDKLTPIERLKAQIARLQAQNAKLREEQADYPKFEECPECHRFASHYPGCSRDKK